MPTWFILILAVLAAVVLIAIVKETFKVRDDNSMSFGNLNIEQNSHGSSEDVSNDKTDKWLTENNIDDDSYGSLLNQYYGLEDPIAIKSVTVDHEEDEVTIVLVFPKTEIEKSIVLEMDYVEFNVVDLEDGPGKATIDFEEDIYSFSPDYDSEIELPIDQMDWDTVVEDISGMEVDLTQEQYDTLFLPALTF